MGEFSRERRFSRRDMLTRVPLAVVGGAILGLGLGKPLISSIFRGRSPETLPEDSFFATADDGRSEKT